ncbi:MAG TPA: hypothetical protein VH186_13450 [Chloroflexia bacterium]|nr:hypothetical protein [Chloroflexia bacterium]
MFKFTRLNPLLFVLLCGLGAWLLLAAAYSLRGDFSLKVGELGDGPYISGFNGDEAGTPRVRWTGGRNLDLENNQPAVGVVNLPLSLLASPSNALRLNIRAAANPPQVTIKVNGVMLGQTQAENGTFKTVEFPIPPEAVTGSDTTRVEIISKAFRQGGDPRALGVQVSEVKLLTTPGFRRPPLNAVLWAWLYIAGIGLILLRITGSAGERVLWAAGAASAALIPWLLIPQLVPAGLNLWYTPVYLPVLAIISGLVALLLWRNSVSGWLADFFDRLETSPRLARNILLVFIALYLIYGFSIIIRMDYVGHADYADNAVAARNIVQGKGYSLDYAAQFYERYTLPRAADTWPPLQPFLIVPFYLVFGVSAWAAKLPNLLLVGVLAWAIFHYGTRHFNRRAALGAAIFTLLAVVPAFSTAPAFFETVAYPINDLVFTLLAFLALNTILDLGFYTMKSRPTAQTLEAPETAEVAEIVAVNAHPGAPGTVKAEPAGGVIAPAESSHLQVEEANDVKDQDYFQIWKSYSIRKEIALVMLVGLWSGLFFLSKPSGTILLVVGALWLLWRKYLGKPKSNLPWKQLLLGAVVALLVVSPFLVRNLLQFHTLYKSTEQYDAWVTKWNPPDEHIYDLFTPFSNNPLPAARQLLEFGWDNDLNAINNQFKKLFTAVLEGQLFPPLLLLLAVLGVWVLPRRRLELAGLLGAALLTYILFINIYWHYEPRYFLVWVPWLALFGLYGLSWLYDRITSSSSVENEPVKSGVYRQRAPWLAGIALLVLFVPGLNALISEGPGFTSATGIVITANWLKQNTAPDAVIMSRNVWELSFHSDRQSVMIPNNASLDQIKQVMKDYHARYLQLDHLGDRDINQVWGQRRDLWPLLDGNTKDKKYQDFKLLYNTSGLMVYEWDGK